LARRAWRGRAHAADRVPKGQPVRLIASAWPVKRWRTALTIFAAAADARKNGHVRQIYGRQSRNVPDWEKD